MNTTPDPVLEKLKEAAKLLTEERNSGKTSREQAVTATQLDTTILWREHDLRTRQSAETSTTTNTNQSNSDDRRRPLK